MRRIRVFRAVVFKNSVCILETLGALNWQSYKMLKLASTVIRKNKKIDRSNDDNNI